MSALVAGCVLLELLLDVDVLLVAALHLVFQIFAGLTQLGDVGLHLVFLLLSHQSLAHAVRDGRLVQRLVGLHGHLDLVADSHQQEASLGAVDGDLTDELIEALRVQLLANGADASLAGLSSLQGFVEAVLELNNIDAVSRRRRDVTDPESAILGELTRWQDRVEVVLLARGACFLERGKCGLTLLALLILGSGQRRADLHGSRVLDEGFT